MRTGEVWAGLTPNTPVYAEREFADLSELLNERGWTRVLFSHNVFSRTTIPQLSAEEWPMPQQFCGIVDETLTSEVPVVYGARIIIDPVDFPGWERLTFFVERDTELDDQVFQTRYPSEFPLTVELRGDYPYVLPVSREYPFLARNPLRRKNDVVRRLLADRDLADHFSGRDVGYLRRHLRTAGWFALTDRLSLFASAGEGDDARVESIYSREHVGTLLEHTSMRIQYLNHWFDALEKAYPSGAFLQREPLPEDHSWPFPMSLHDLEDGVLVGYEPPRDYREPLKVDDYETALRLMNAVRGDFLDPVVLFDRSIANVQDGEIVGYVCPEPKGTV